MLSNVGAICDVDIHHAWGSDAELLEYLPRRLAEYFRSSGSVVPAQYLYPRTDGHSMRMDAFPPGGGAPGSDYAMLREQLLDREGLDVGLLTYGFGTQSAFTNAQMAIALCKAANDWCIDRWLSLGDPRLYGVILTPCGTPSAAAEEIRRLAGHPRMVGALMVSNALNRPFGDPIYDPIYDAATEAGLPIVTHLGSESGVSGTMTASGIPTCKPEFYTLLEQPAMHHLSSMLVGGVFDRFPTLRVLYNEWGFTWVPWLLWALDGSYAELRAEGQTLERLPSEYLFDHVWFDTQPFESGVSGRRLRKVVEGLPGLEKRLCFASDYPHWDADPPREIAARLPREWRAGVMAENAAELFGWTLPQTTAIGNGAEPAGVAQRDLRDAV
jgi:uncharacterized protein